MSSKICYTVDMKKYPGIKLAVDELKKGGLSYGEIAKIVGVSRQRIHQIHKDIKTSSKLYKRSNILYINGKSIVVKKRTRPDDICEICGKHVTKLDYHHWNDDMPEYGLWICAKCHKQCERIEKGIGKKYVQLKIEVEAGRI